MGDDQGIGELQDYQLIEDEFKDNVTIFADLVKKANSTSMSPPYFVFSSSLIISAGLSRYWTMGGSCPRSV